MNHLKHIILDEKAPYIVKALSAMLDYDNTYGKGSAPALIQRALNVKVNSEELEKFINKSLNK